MENLSGYLDQLCECQDIGVSANLSNLYMETQIDGCMDISAFMEKYLSVSKSIHDVVFSRRAEISQIGGSVNGIAMMYLQSCVKEPDASKFAEEYFETIKTISEKISNSDK